VALVFRDAAQIVSDAVHVGDVVHCADRRKNAFVELGASIRPPRPFISEISTRTELIALHQDCAATGGVVQWSPTAMLRTVVRRIACQQNHGVYRARPLLSLATGCMHAADGLQPYAFAWAHGNQPGSPVPCSFVFIPSGVVNLRVLQL
jgi:hypothetical protein